MPLATQEPSTNGSEPQASQSTAPPSCPGCGGDILPETKHGRYCTRACALTHGRREARQAARLAKVVESDEYLNERVDRALAAALDRTLVLAVTEVLPDALSKVLPTILPNALTTNTLRDAVRPLMMSEVEKALATTQDVQTPDPKPDAAVKKLPSKGPTNRAEQMAHIEGLQEAILRRLDPLPVGWKRGVAVRQSSGFVVEVTY